MRSIAEAFSSGLILPAAILAFLGWAIPRLNALWLPEGVRPLMVNAFVSTLMLGLLGMGYFAVLYLWQGMPFSVLFDEGIISGIAYFGRLSLISALLWLPIMVLSLSGLPKNWVKETW